MNKLPFLVATLMCSTWCIIAQNSSNGHEWIDLGLPSGLKWATCNVGATKPEEYGDYFAWGETVPKITYDWSTYKYGAAYDKLTKYCTNALYGLDNFANSKTILDIEDDAANSDWGGNWRIPTFEEWTELREHCIWTWTANYNNIGISGYIVTGKNNGKSIFLPAAGSYNDDDLNDAGNSGLYWSSSINMADPYFAWHVRFSADLLFAYSVGRIYGLSIRPVLKE